MKQITWKLSAETRFNNFITLLRIENPEAVDKWKQKIEFNIEKLRNFPKMGKQTKFLNYREIVIPPFRIFYKILEQEIVITSFFHSRRNRSLN